jgi:hypothetical protein
VLSKAFPHYFGSKPEKLSHKLSGDLFRFRLLILESTVEQELPNSPFAMGVMQLDTTRFMNEVHFGPQSFLGSVVALLRFLRSDLKLAAQTALPISEADTFPLGSLKSSPYF